MATIRKKIGVNGDIQWHAQIRRKGFPNQTKTFLKRSDAEEWASIIESEIARKVFIPHGEAERTTLDEALQRYEREVTSSKKGAVQEKSVIAQLRKTDLAKRFIASIRGVDVAKLRDDYVAEGYDPGTINRRFNVLSHVFNTAKREWGMESLSNPVESVRRPKQPASRTRRLMDGELERLLDATESDELGAIVLLAVETAMRRSEITSLTRDKVNLKTSTLTLLDTKNGESRVVPLSSRAVAILKKLPARTSGKVFGMRPNSITQAFMRSCQRARATYEAECASNDKKPQSGYLQNLRFHDLRHEATSRLFELGALELMEVAAITGHKSLQMLKRYTHLHAEKLAKKLG